MNEQEILKKINSNRAEIARLLESELPLEFIYFNVRRLTASNKRLIKELNS